MKIRGKKISGANEIDIVIPRNSSEDIILKARAVLDLSPLDEIFPRPLPPRKMLPGGKEVPNFNDSGFLSQMSNYATKRLSWIVLSSLDATEGLEWEKVDLSDPSTWNSFREEMMEAGFSSVEIDRIVQYCIEVNALNEEKIEEARERFLLGAQELDEE